MSLQYLSLNIKVCLMFIVGSFSTNVFFHSHYIVCNDCRFMPACHLLSISLTLDLLQQSLLQILLYVFEMSVLLYLERKNRFTIYLSFKVSWFT